MIKVKAPDYPGSATSEKMVDGETSEIAASKAVEDDGFLILYKRDWKLSLYEVARFWPHEWESWEKV